MFILLNSSICLSPVAHLNITCCLTLKQIEQCSEILTQVLMHVWTCKSMLPHHTCMHTCAHYDMSHLCGHLGNHAGADLLGKLLHHHLQTEGSDWFVYPAIKTRSTNRMTLLDGHLFTGRQSRWREHHVSFTLVPLGSAVFFVLLPVWWWAAGFRRFACRTWIRCLGVARTFSILRCMKERKKSRTVRQNRIWPRLFQTTSVMQQQTNPPQSSMLWEAIKVDCVQVAVFSFST